MRRIMLPALLAGLMAVGMSADTKYGVKVTADKATNFAAFKSYTWSPGWPAADKAVHAHLVAAIDAQLASLGLEKRDAGPSDVVVLYAAVRRTDVDLKSKMDEETKLRREYPVGSLVIILRDPASAKELFKGRVDKVLDVDPAKLTPILDAAVTDIFAQYPTKKGK